MKYSELLKTLKKHGWKIERHGARHDLYVHDERAGVQIPILRHLAKEVPSGTLNAIYQDAGLK